MRIIFIFLNSKLKIGFIHGFHFKNEFLVNCLLLIESEPIIEFWDLEVEAHSIWGLWTRQPTKNAREKFLKSCSATTFSGWVQNGFSWATQGLGIVGCRPRPLSYTRPLLKNAT